MMNFRNFASTGKKIVAIGRNFSEHAKELGNAVPTKPFFFLKPTSSYLSMPGNVELPGGCSVHYEVELGVVISRRARDILPEDADKYIAGYALGIDMTARNLQDDAKKKGLPWSAAKGFDTFTPISEFIPKEKIPDTSNINLWLKINDEMKQNGTTRDMIFPVPSLLEHISSIMTLEPGDLVLTGTPSGVGPVQPGQTIKAGMKLPDAKENLMEVEFGVVERNGRFRV